MNMTDLFFGFASRVVSTSGGMVCPIRRAASDAPCPSVHFDPPRYNYYLPPPSYILNGDTIWIMKGPNDSEVAGKATEGERENNIPRQLTA